MKRSQDWNPSQTLTADDIKSSGIILSSPMVTIKMLHISQLIAFVNNQAADCSLNAVFIVIN